ncbi:MAG: hypothetical protein R3E82_02155 [Pseudomonadales bacterium]
MLRITNTRNLWWLFFATLLLTASFVVCSSLWNLTLLDGVSSPVEVRRILAGMSPEQIRAHIWITATLDVAYPLAYGGLFAGAALSGFATCGRYLALPALLAIPVDLLEGVVQVLALTDSGDLIDTKAYITPLKTALFLSGLVIALAAWMKWLIVRIGRA